MNYLTLKTLNRHINLKSQSTITNKLITNPITISWSLNQHQNKKLNLYLNYILFSYYSWNILLQFKTNAKHIYISKLIGTLQPLTLLNLLEPTQKLNLTLINKLKTHQFVNYMPKFNTQFLSYTLFTKKYININKLNFELVLNSKFNLFGLFWFQSNTTLKSKFLFSKLNLN